MELKISIVTCSDTRDLAQDEAGAALEELIVAQGWTVASHVVVRDDASEIGDAIVEAADECHANVVLTCGGTGLSMRDVTPEATRAIAQALGLTHIDDRPRAVHELVDARRQRQQGHLLLEIRFFRFSHTPCKFSKYIANRKVYKKVAFFV